MALKKEVRLAVYNKLNGHCGYCGLEIKYEQMQVDHIIPKAGHGGGLYGFEKGADDFDNLMPACRRCNNWKNVFSVEQFRYEIAQQPGRLHRYQNGFRLGADFGLITVIEKPIIFYFEKANE